jgi:hypothetical protein
MTFSRSLALPVPLLALTFGSCSVGGETGPMGATGGWARPAPMGATAADRNRRCGGLGRGRRILACDVRATYGSVAHATAEENLHNDLRNANIANGAVTVALALWIVQVAGGAELPPEEHAPLIGAF